MISVVILMAVFCYVRARQRIFWGDELNGFLVLRDKSFVLMLQHFWASLDSGSLFFFVFGRLWLQIFPATEGSLRAFSAAGVAASFLILWVTARRFYSIGVVGICLPVPFFLNETLRWQLYNGRMYGGFLAATALVVYAFVRAAPDKPLSPRVLLLTFFAHLFLICSHILGVLYSGVFIAGLVAQDLRAHRFRPKLYLSALAGWIALLATFANIRNTARVAKYGYFTVAPRLRDLVEGCVVYSPRLLYLIVTLLSAAILTRLVMGKSSQRRLEVPARLSIYFVLLCFAGILLVAFVVSRLTTSIFYNRYLLPVCLGDALLMCELVHRIADSLRRWPVLRYAGVAAGIVCFAVLYSRQLRAPFSFPETDYTQAMLAKAPSGVPLVISDVGAFAQMAFYQGRRAFIVTPLDWGVALSPDAGPGGSSATEQLQRWKDAGVLDGNILSSREILSRFPEFVLIEAPDHTLWFRRYLQGNPRYDLANEGSSHGDEVWLVRTHASTSPALSGEGTQPGVSRERGSLRPALQ